MPRREGTALMNRDTAEGRRQTTRRRALQPLWSALERWLGPALERGALLAVSGGPDSAALMEACATWPRRPRAALEVACVDHGHRPEAAAEALAVCTRAAALGLPAEVLTATPGRGDEASLRKLRYGLLWSRARERGLGVVVTAHHRGDDAEGLLLDLLGLGGGRGGAGMRHTRVLAEGTLVRPFLDLSRAELRAALAAVEAPAPVIDPEDARGANARARVRLQVLPALLAVAPGAEELLARKARRRCEDEEALAQWAAKLLVPTEDGYEIRAEGAPVAVVRRAVHEALRRLAPAKDPRRSGRTVDDLLAAAGVVPGYPLRPGAMFDLPGAVAGICPTGQQIWMHRAAIAPAPGVKAV